MPNYKPAFILPFEKEPCTNAQVFTTAEEAEASAHARFLVWTLPTNWGVVETEDPVNYKFIDGKDVMI